MTSNATSLNIRKATNRGLVKHKAYQEINERIREILCAEDVEEHLTGKTLTDCPWMGFAWTIGRFLAGYSLTVSQKHRVGKRRKGRDPDIELERLEGYDEIWVLCHRKPGSGWRVAGRFLERNVLVLFRVYDKRDIGNDYAPVAAQVLEDWTTYFGTQPPCRGAWISAYLSGSHYDADEKKQI